MLLTLISRGDSLETGVTPTSLPDGLFERKAKESEEIPFSGHRDFNICRFPSALSRETVLFYSCFNLFLLFPYDMPIEAI